MIPLSCCSWASAAVSFLCPPFAVSNAAEATQNYAECEMGVLCGGDQLYAGVCPYTGGSYTGCKSS